MASSFSSAHLLSAPVTPQAARYHRPLHSRRKNADAVTGDGISPRSAAVAASEGVYQSRRSAWRALIPRRPPCQRAIFVRIRPAPLPRSTPRASLTSVFISQIQCRSQNRNETLERTISDVAGRGARFALNLNTAVVFVRKGGMGRLTRKDASVETIQVY